MTGVQTCALPISSTHIRPDPRRTRKLLLHHEEIRKLVGAVDRRGYTLVPLAMYWKRGRAKLEIALAKGKHKHDKRSAIRQREAEREQQRALKAVRGKG